MKPAETDKGAKTGDAKTASTTTTATLTVPVAATNAAAAASIPEEPKKENKTAHKNKVAFMNNDYANGMLKVKQLKLN